MEVADEARAEPTLASVLEQVPLPVLAVAGEEARITAANARAREVFGPVQGRPLHQAVPSPAAERLLAAVARVLATGGPHTVPECPVPGPAGQDQRLTFLAAPWRPPSGGAGVVFTGHAPTPGPAAPERRHPTPGLAAVAQAQRAALPAALPVLPGLELAAQYLPAERAEAAGGDWFDAVVLDGGALAAVVGDVTGSGVAATAAMTRVRTVLSERLAAGDGLTRAVGAADRFAARDEGAFGATVCVAVIDPVTGTVEYTTHGHPAPVVVDAQAGVVPLPRTGGTPLGTGGETAVHRATVPPGGALLLFSDGLVERAGEQSEQLALLGAVAGAGTAASPAAGSARTPPTRRESAATALTRRAAAALAETGRADDVATLVVTRRPAPVAPLLVTMAALAGELRTLRGAVGAWLQDLGADSRDQMSLILAVSEAAANSVEHAYRSRPQGHITLAGRLLPDGVVELRVSDDGRWSEPAATPADRGRGLALVSGAVDSLTLVRGEHGTTVTMRRRLGVAPLFDAPGPADAHADNGETGLTLSVRGGRPPTLVVAGAIDAATAAALRVELLRVTRAGVAAADVDLTAVTHLGSAGVRLLYAVLRAVPGLSGAGVRLLAAPGSPAARSLDLAGLAWTPA